jgi:four helix bundle protein
MSGKYQDLKVWQLSMEVAEDIYELTRTFPGEELYGMRVANAASDSFDSDNIAERKGAQQ